MRKKIKFQIEVLCKAVQLIWRSSHRLTLFFFLTNIILGTFGPLLMIVWKCFIDSATTAMVTRNNVEVKQAFLFLIIHCICIISMDFVNQLATYCQDMQRDYLNKYILNMTLKKISELKLEHFDNAEIYNKIEKVNNESSQRTVSMLSLLVVIIRAVTSLSGTVIILLKLNVFFVLLCFLASIPMFIVSTKVSLKKYSLFNNRMEKMRLVYSIKYLMSKYENIKEIKIFRLGDFLKNKAIDVYSNNLAEDRIVRKKYLWNISLADIIQNIISYSFKLYILLTIVWNNGYTLGDLTMFITAIEGFQVSIQSFLQAVSDLYIDGLYLENLFSLLNITVERTEKKEFSGDFREIVFEDVWFRYPNNEKYILQGINCKFKVGESYCIVGLNASGKTTLVKLLTKLYKPTKGRILVDGIDLQEIDEKTYYKHIGVIFQDFIKYPFNVKENIGVGNIERVHDMDLIREIAKITEADKFISKLPCEYDTLLQKEWSGGVELSLGQWQKIAISRAYLSESSIVILDEPTASLDAEAEADVYRQFEQLMKNKLCVLVSHRLSVNKLMGQVLLLEDGRIIEKGTHKELIKKDGRYASYYNMQANSYKDEK